MSSRGAIGLAVALLAGVAATLAQEAPRVSPAPADSDLRALRDIFRYADDPVVPAARAPGAAARADDAGQEAASPVPSRARLVGLVQRGGRLVAALALDGEVVLLAENESAAGFTVLAGTEEAVRLRGPEGDETWLALP